MLTQLDGKSVCILGLGISGCSAAKYLLSQGALVYVVDDRWDTIQHQEPIQKLLTLGACQTETLPAGIEFLVVSPGVPRTHPLYVSAINQEVQVVGEAELALGVLAKTHPCIGITGTNGKTTVTLLIEYLLNTCGIPAKALGNSGVPLTSSLLEKYPAETVIVAELSSFQLETLQTPVLDTAILLNITYDHMDRYFSFEEYLRTKVHLFDCLKPEGKGYVEERCFQKFSNFLAEYDLKRFGIESSDYLSVRNSHLETPTSSHRLPEIHLTQSDHDLENLMAALTAVLPFISVQEALDALPTFKKPSHRLEFVKEIKGITFIDDSKATNVDAVVRAIESISSPIILIAGGVDKGGSYQPWLKAFQNKVKAICTIGEAAKKIELELGNEVPIYSFEGLVEAVAFAASIAKQNDCVLLSPGCSSYDQFTSYVQRGMVFQDAVHALDIKDES